MTIAIGGLPVYLIAKISMRKRKSKASPIET